MPAFRDFDVAVFLRDTWQQRPLLVRGAFRDWTNPLEPDELAGLACEESVESRLVQQPAAGVWELENGPFETTRFARMGDKPWTLLVQAVDHHVPAVAELIEPFRFIPDWRIDDVMVSYAVDRAGVGPHFDQYDVFLVQGLGRRLWRVGRRCDDTAPLLPHDGLRLLAEFEPHAEWVLEPGDMLYVPPGFAHDGVALGDDCMTYSVGFRAPSRGDLVSAWADEVLDTLTEDDRYTDPDLTTRAHPGEISTEALTRLHEMAVGVLADRTAFAAWFGRYITEPKDDGLDWSPDAPVSAAGLSSARAAVTLDRNPASRFAFTRHGEDTLTLFVDGASYMCTGMVADIAGRLCAGPTCVVEADELAVAEVAGLLADLVNRGALAIGEAC